MSHVAKVKMKEKVDSLDILARCCKRIGLELVTGCSSYRYFAGKNQKCSQKITIPGNKDCYEIGVIENNDGSFTFEWDTFSGGKGIVAKAGTDCSKILQAYKEEKLRTEATATANELGGYVTEGYNTNGELMFEITTY